MIFTLNGYSLSQSANLFLYFLESAKEKIAIDRQDYVLLAYCSNKIKNFIVRTFSIEQIQINLVFLLKLQIN
jgi:hypothetical protein